MQPEPEVIRPNYKGSDKLKDKVALITGGDSGIGRSVAVHFAREGCDVAIVYLEQENYDAQTTKQLVEQEGRKCVLIPGDIREREFCSWAVKKTVQQLGKLNILVNNAAEQHPVDDFKKIDLDVMESTFRTNIFAMFYLTQEALNHLKPGDSIINSTSVTNYRGNQAADRLLRDQGGDHRLYPFPGKEPGRKGIRVNAVAPGPIWTPLIPVHVHARST